MTRLNLQNCKVSNESVNLFLAQMITDLKCAEYDSEVVRDMTPNTKTRPKQKQKTILPIEHLNFSNLKLKNTENIVTILQ